ncbi:MAG TPA: hypothetical protein VFR69_00795 [Rubrobacteraceae bacterium]|nr:hypothetical protein [Rubrobacteraceae bacterium]
MGRRYKPRASRRNFTEARHGDVLPAGVHANGFVLGTIIAIRANIALLEACYIP